VAGVCSSVAGSVCGGIQAVVGQGSGGVGKVVGGGAVCVVVVAGSGGRVNAAAVGVSRAADEIEGQRLPYHSL